MPRSTFSTGFLRGASGGLGNLASAIAGAGRAGQSAYDNELTAQSRIGQAIAAAQANQAKASQDEAETAILARRPDVFEESVAGRAGTTIPNVRATREFMRTGVMPSRELPGPADEMGNGPGSAPLVSPEQLSAITREISRLAPALLGNVKDNKADDLAAADKAYQDADMQRQAVDGSMSADQTGRAMALLKATPLFKIPEGYTGNQFTGGIDIQSPVNATRQGYIGAQTQERKAAAAENYAQAANARASAAKSAAATPSASGGPATMPMKAMPAAALKMRQESLDAIGTASNMSSDLGALVSQIEGGALNLGPVDNLISEGRNFAGLSNDNSRNYQSFKATLEKLRNDSLRLNKGVQTDGDAQRAWNELLTNINDPQVVMQRLREIDAINRRAVELHQFNLNQVDQNYGRAPLNTAPLRNPPPAVGAMPPAGRPAAPAPAGKTVVRTGRDASGRKVVQYSDGSVSYAD